MSNKGAWAEIYRPQTIEETILPERIKERFRSYVSEGEIPNLILAGPAGVGKTTIAKAALAELDADTLFINGSLEGGKDTFRYKVASFASSISFQGGRKYVIVDEADDMPVGAQMGFRSFQETFNENCGFIFTCNYPKRILKELHSRFATIDFSLEPEERTSMASQYMKRLVWILDQQNVTYDKKILAEIIMKYFPDFRKVLSEIQAYVNGNNRHVDIGIMRSKTNMDELFKILKDKNFDGMRKWVSEHADQDANLIFRELFNEGAKHAVKSSLPSLMIQLGEYQYKHSFVADPEINLVALLTELMYEVEFK